jgi:lysophospholipase L1-like esterase
MQENTVLAAFVLLPVVLGMLLRFFFRKFRRHEKLPLWLRLIAGNSLLFLFLCSMVLVSGEVYYRFFNDTTDSFGLTKTTQRWFERHFHPNRSGFRDSVDYMNRIPPGRRRVTFIGDSFTAGHGIPSVEDRFANRIRRAIPGNEVHVFAQCGWDTGDQLSFLPALDESEYQTDLVVLVYCLNDIADIVPEWQIIHERVYDSPRPGFFIENSYSLNMMYYRWKATRDPDVSNYYQFVRENYEGPIWEQQKRRLRLFRDKVRSRNGKLLVVTFPFLHALGPEYEYQPIHDCLSEQWSELDVPHLDLLSVYESLDPAEVVVNANDAHPNENAHAMAADAIAEFLKKHLKPASSNHGD